MIIREITVEDIDDFIRLAGQLGYEVNLKHLKNRIENKDTFESVFMAVEDTKITGWIDCKIQQSYLIEPFCEIEGLIVDEQARGKKIGAKLVCRAEEWAKQKEVNTVVVRSNVIRERAHKFYLNNGYKNVKQSKIFKKVLNVCFIGYSI